MSARSSALGFCAVPNCSNRVARGRCPVHRLEYERSRPNTVIRRWYGTVRWFRLRAAVFTQQPRCAQCLAEGIDTLATEVDHVRPHRGDPVLFWDRRNLQGLCAECHARKTGRGA